MGLSINVKLKELKSVATSLAAKNTELYSLYKTDFTNILDESKSYLQISGLKYEEVEESFKTLFNNLHNQINDLTSVLTSQVITNYQSGADTVKKLFNSDFASSMSEIMAEINR